MDTIPCTAFGVGCGGTLDDEGVCSTCGAVCRETCGPRTVTYGNVTIEDYRHAAPRQTTLPSGTVVFDCDACGMHLVD